MFFYDPVVLGTAGGYSLYGNLFKITASGTLTPLIYFCQNAGAGCAEGGNPSELVQAIDGNFYGTTEIGNENGGAGGGTVFKMTPSGTLTTIYSFCSETGCTDGEGPSPFGALVQATNGDFYGTTAGGGYGTYRGTVFKITSTGTLTTLHRFCAQPQNGCPDGAQPFTALVQATDGNLYGTTPEGGTGDHGTIFRITPDGTLTTLYRFCSQMECPDGSVPNGLVQASDGNFYGTTFTGGAQGQGTVFELTPGGALTTLYSFCAQSECADGFEPKAGLLQATDGNFYGTTLYGGACSSDPSGGCGIVFSLSVGLTPFVKPQPATARVGGFVEILGTSLTGATSVTFNGTPAVFKVLSGSLIATSVPAGASSGIVQVVTPSGTLSSNVPFRVP